MKPIVAGFAAAIVLLAVSPASFAQPAAKVHRIGIVVPPPASPEPPTVRAFREGLRALSYIEGKNLIIEARFAAGRIERFPELVAELLHLRVDLLVAGSSPAALAARNATSTVPIVFAGILDPIASGIVTSLARPGGNVTGATYAAGGAAIAAKWVELLKEAVPETRHVAVLLNSRELPTADYLREVLAAATSLKLRVGTFDAGDDSSLEKAFAAIGVSGAQGVVVFASAYFGGNRAKIVRSVADTRLPAVYFFSLFPEDGGLMSYGGSAEDSFRRAAVYVDRILKGAKPAELPVDQATKFELVVNLKTARALGIAVPRSLLARADRVIE